MKKISKIFVLLFTFVLMVSIPMLTLSAENSYTNYTIQVNNIAIIDSDVDLIIEDYSSSIEWFSSNGDYYTRIRFHRNIDYTPQGVPGIIKIQMYYENITLGTSVLACTFRDLGGLNSKYVPMWTNEFFQTIQVLNQPYENNDLFNQVFTDSTYKRFNVSIGTDYKFDVLDFDWYSSVNVLYYGRFILPTDNEYTNSEFDTMTLVRDEINDRYLVCFTSRRFYTQYELSQIDGMEIEIASLYTYTGSEFPQYIYTEDVEVDGWNDFFISIIDVPLYYLYSLLSIEIFGVNVWLGLGTLVLAGFVVLLIKKVL